MLAHQGVASRSRTFEAVLHQQPQSPWSAKHSRDEELAAGLAGQRKNKEEMDDDPQELIL